MVKVAGYSMSPTLSPGDILIVSSARSIRHNEIGVFSVNNSDYTVKRYDHKGWRLICDNEVKQEVVVCVVKQVIRNISEKT